MKKLNKNTLMYLDIFLATCRQLGLWCRSTDQAAYKKAHIKADLVNR